MLIGIDAREINTKPFIKDLLFMMTQNNTKDNFIIYLPLDIEVDTSFLKDNFGVRFIDYPIFSFSEQFKFLGDLKNDNLDLFISFSTQRPVFYKKRNFLFCDSLTELFYPTEATNTSIKKHLYHFLLKKSLSNASNIITFSNQTKKDINERLNINEEKIHILSPFLYEKNIKENSLDTPIDIFFTNPYLVYSGGTTYDKNIEKLLDAIKKLGDKKINLALIGNHFESDFIKNLLKSKNIEQNVKIIKNDDKYIDTIYKNSIGYIYPATYDPNPYILATPISYNVPIISSNLESIKNILGEDNIYFNPSSLKDICDKIIDLNNSKNIKNYNKKEIFEKFSINNMVKELMKMIGEDD